MHKFADNNSLSAIAKTAAELKNTLQSESEAVINWFKNNKMMVNPEKFQVIVLEKQKHDYSNKIIKLDNETIETVSRYANIEQIKIRRTYVCHLLNLVSMLGTEGKNLEICHSRLPENAFASTRKSKSVPSKFANIFNKSHVVVLKLEENRKQT